MSVYSNCFLIDFEIFAIGVGEEFFMHNREIKAISTLPTYSHSLITDYSSLADTVNVFFDKLKNGKFSKFTVNKIFNFFSQLTFSNI